MEHFGVGSAPRVDRSVCQQRFVICPSLWWHWEDWELQQWDEAGNGAFIPRGVEEFLLVSRATGMGSLLPSLQATGNQLNLTGVKLANFFSKP